MEPHDPLKVVGPLKIRQTTWRALSFSLMALAMIVGSFARILYWGGSSVPLPSKGRIHALSCYPKVVYLTKSQYVVVHPATFLGLILLSILAGVMSDSRRADPYPEE